MNITGLSWPRHAWLTLDDLQLIVEDPEGFLRHLKQRLTLKEGIPELQQRLIFSVPRSIEAGGGDHCAQPSVEDILGELGSWQVTLLQLTRSKQPWPGA